MSNHYRSLPVEDRAALLLKYRQNLAHLLLQAASYGGPSHWPLEQLNHINEVGQIVADLQADLPAESVISPTVRAEVRVNYTMRAVRAVGTGFIAWIMTAQSFPFMAIIVVASLGGVFIEFATEQVIEFFTERDAFHTAWSQITPEHRKHVIRRIVKRSVELGLIAAAMVALTRVSGG